MVGDVRLLAAIVGRPCTLLALRGSAIVSSSFFFLLFLLLVITSIDSESYPDRRDDGDPKGYLQHWSYGFVINFSSLFIFLAAAALCLCAGIGTGTTGTVKGPSLGIEGELED